MTKTFILSLFACVACMGTAFASFDFSAADGLYAARENNFAKIHEARAAYAAALAGSPTAEDKIYAIEQMSKLDVYETTLVTDNNQIKQISLACYDNVTNIAPSAVGSTPAYFYWRAACLAVWGRANGVLASLSRSSELVELIEAGNKVDSTYEGGGFYRLGAAVYSKLPAINPLGPSGNMDLALKYIDLAIASPAYANAVDPETSTGDYFYNAYQFKAEILDKLHRKDEAIALLKQVIARLQAGDLPVGREAETRVYLADLQKTLADLQ